MAVSTAALAELIEEWLKTHQLSDLATPFGYKEGSIQRSVYTVRRLERPTVTFWKADAICSAMGRPDWLQALS